MLANTAEAWGAPAKFFHWTVALLILVQIGLGFTAALWRLSPLKLELFVWHKSTGMLILVLMLARPRPQRYWPASASLYYLIPVQRVALLFQIGNYSHSIVAGGLEEIS